MSYTENEWIANATGTKTILVTPELAEKWLRLNKKNRSLSKGLLTDLTGRMNRGEWLLNGQPVIFSNEGYLLDGQHRLNAVIKHGSPVLFDVKFGITPNAFETIDEGKKRTGGDVLSITNVKDATNVSATILKVIFLEKGHKFKYGVHNRPSNSQVLDYYNNHTEINEFVKMGRDWYKHSGRILSTSKFAAYAYVMSKISHEQAIEFMNMIAYGSGHDKHHPVFNLRLRLIQSKTDRTKKLIESYERALIIKAWNFFRKGAKIKILSYDSSKEAFPRFQ